MVAAIFMAGVRETDMVCRTGGEEFLFLFPGQTAEEAAISVERCRAAVEAQKFSVGDPPVNIRLTMSAGIAACRNKASREGATDAGPLLRRADESLYAAKARGRNQLVLDGSVPLHLAPH